MKKRIITFLMLIAILVLTGCNKKVNFTDGLKFKDKLSTNEKLAVIVNVEHAMVNLVQVEGNINQKTYNEIEENNVVAQVTEKLHSGFQVRFTGSLTNTSIKSGLTTVQEGKIEVDDFYDEMYDTHVHRAIYGDESDLEFEEYTIEEYQALNESYYRDLVYGEELSILKDLDAYKDGSGYVFISSSINKNVEGVAWGNTVKEHTTITKTQTIAKVNSNYQLTSIQKVTETLTNRDTQTNAWYDKETQTSYDSSSFQYKYGTRKGDTKRMADVRKELSAMIVGEVELELTGVNNDDSFIVNLTHKRDSLQKVHVVGRYTLNYDVDKEFEYEPTVFVTVYNKYKETRDEYPVIFGVYSEKDNQYIESDNVKFTYVKGTQVIFEFDVEIINGQVNITGAKVDFVK